MILAGDVGGTKVLLMLADGDRQVAQERYPSRDFGNLTEIVRAFLARTGSRPERAAFGVAGPVEDNRSRATNLPWDIDGDRLGADLGIRKVRLLNDFAAIGHGLEVLAPHEIAPLNAPEPDPRFPVAILGAGTGLGEACLVPCGDRRVFVPSEGGHADLAPRDDREMGFLRFMLRVHKRVSVERAVSGQGIVNLFNYLAATGRQPAEAVTREIEEGADVAAVVAAHAADRSCLVCAEAMDMFWNLYGAEAGNMALKVLPRGGLYLAGGIVAKNFEALRSGPFMAAYGAKGRMSDLVREFPVRVILNQNVGLLGAALVAGGL